MTVIYIDTLFLLNALVDYLLLLAAARLAGEPLRRWRFALGAGLGGVYAVAIFLPGLSFLAHPLCRLASVALMMVVSYGGSRRLLRQGLLFVALTCAFGGGVVAIGLLGGTGLSLGNGVFYSALDLKVVLLSAAVCYGVLTLVFRRLAQHSPPWWTPETHSPTRCPAGRWWWRRGSGPPPCFPGNTAPGRAI